MRDEVISSGVVFEMSHIDCDLGNTVWAMERSSSLLFSQNCTASSWECSWHFPHYSMCGKYGSVFYFPSKFVGQVPSLLVKQ